MAELAKRCTKVRTQQVKLSESDSTPKLDTLGRILEGLDANLCDLHRAIVDPHWQPPPVSEDTVTLPSLLGQAAQIGHAIELLRRRIPLTLQQFADRLGASNSRASNIEAGAMLVLGTLERVLAALDATLLDFHEALLLAHFLQNWKAKPPRPEPRLRAGLLILGQAHLGSHDEARLVDALRSFVEREEPRPS